MATGKRTAFVGDTAPHLAGYTPPVGALWWDTVAGKIRVCTAMYPYTWAPIAPEHLASTVARARESHLDLIALAAEVTF